MVRYKTHSVVLSGDTSHVRSAVLRGVRERFPGNVVHIAPGLARSLLSAGVPDARSESPEAAGDLLWDFHRLLAVAHKEHWRLTKNYAWHKGYKLVLYDRAELDGVPFVPRVVSDSRLNRDKFLERVGSDDVSASEVFKRYNTVIVVRSGSLERDLEFLGAWQGHPCLLATPHAERPNVEEAIRYVEKALKEELEKVSVAKS